MAPKDIWQLPDLSRAAAMVAVEDHFASKAIYFESRVENGEELTEWETRQLQAAWAVQRMIDVLRAEAAQ